MTSLRGNVGVTGNKSLALFLGKCRRWQMLEAVYAVQDHTWRENEEKKALVPALGHPRM